MATPLENVVALRAALEASWDERTSYRGAVRDGNPAVGQCYPTSWLVQQLDPRAEIVRGTVAAADGVHTHFWNVLRMGGCLVHVDLTWQQFPPGARVRHFELLDRAHLGDGPATVARCELLLRRVCAVIG
jgi:hypothetical protein